jgi:hypothetical protein
LYLVDAAVDTVSVVGQHAATAGADTVHVAVNTFFASVTTRLVGVLIGNIVAASFVKYVTDFFKKSFSGNNDNGEQDSTKRRRGKNNKERSGGGREATIPSDAYFKLLLCVAIDLLGDSSFILPGVGELEDVAWAPMSAFAMKSMFGSNALAGLDFAKEILPVTDIIPLATIAWIFTYAVSQPNPISEVLGLKRSLPDTAKDEDNFFRKDNDDVIDV